MREEFLLLLNRFGQSVLLIRSGEHPLSVKAFLQPLLKEREALPLAVTALGAVSKQRWLYLDDGTQSLSPGDRIQWDSLHFVVQEIQEVALVDELIYRRAILRPAKEAAS